MSAAAMTDDHRRHPAHNDCDVFPRGALHGAVGSDSAEVGCHSGPRLPRDQALGWSASVTREI